MSLTPVADTLTEAEEKFAAAAEQVQYVEYGLDEDDDSEDELDSTLTAASIAVIEGLGACLDAFRALQARGAPIIETQHRKLVVEEQAGELERKAVLVQGDDGRYTAIEIIVLDEKRYAELESATIIDQALFASLGNAALVQKDMAREVKHMEEVMGRVRQRIFLAGAATA